MYKGQQLFANGIGRAWSVFKTTKMGDTGLDIVCK